MATLLSAQDLSAIRARLIELAAKPDAKLSRIKLASLTQIQFDQLNVLRLKTNRPVLKTKELEFVGRHFCASRIKDGYTIDDMMEQIASALSFESMAEISRGEQKFVNLVNPIKRDDGYGNHVNDSAAFNVSDRNPTTELFSVIPKGDVRKPKKDHQTPPAIGNSGPDV